MQDYVERCREWQKNNSDYTLVCDVQDSATYYVQWSELPQDERMSWIGKYGRCAKDAFDEFAAKRCKVECAVLDQDLNLHDIMDWPQGRAMMVFRTSVDGVSVI